ncbi:DoxX family protein [Chelativorans sp. J32]|uniref:DoxX family protein n=1 Tax=Chelativorans sp. J32 TaxID=935840 RepID=UPI0004ADD9D3|nr:DoxX family protein [Chelativorans sp. J32]
MDIVTDILFRGIGGSDVALTLNRVAIGVFFGLCGYHKLFNAQRHASLVEELKRCGIPWIGFNQWWVPLVEFSGGAAITIGLLTPLAALGLLVIIIVAVATTGSQRVKIYKPIDEADRLDDWLYLPETLYAIMLIVIVTGGPGPYSLDAMILNFLRHSS